MKRNQGCDIGFLKEIKRRFHKSGSEFFNESHSLYNWQKIYHLVSPKYLSGKSQKSPKCHQKFSKYFEKLSWFPLFCRKNAPMLSYFVRIFCKISFNGRSWERKILINHQVKYLANANSAFTIFLHWRHDRFIVY